MYLLLTCLFHSPPSSHDIQESSLQWARPAHGHNHYTKQTHSVSCILYKPQRLRNIKPNNQSTPKQHLLGKSDGGSGRRGSPPGRNTRPPRRGLGWRSSRSVRSTFSQQRSTASTVSATSRSRRVLIISLNTLLRTCAVQMVVTSSDCKRPRGTELPKLRHLDTASFSAVIVAWLRAGKGSMGLDWR